jgi:diadenosine tetraphosphate (Ap4A) HIT family hydrolase
MLKRGCNKCERLKNKDYFWENDSVVVYFSRKDFKGHIVVLLKKHKEKVTQMTTKESHDMMDAMIKAAKAIEKTIKPDIINYQYNMNWVGHVHCHIYPRFKKDDACWGEPICIPKKNAKFKKKELSKKEEKKIISLVRKIRGK